MFDCKPCSTSVDTEAKVSDDASVAVGDCGGQISPGSTKEVKGLTKGPKAQ
jgi:hypothetical protein